MKYANKDEGIKFKSALILKMISSSIRCFSGTPFPFVYLVYFVV